jgi:hypothetical protein
MSAAEAYHFAGLPGRKPLISRRTAKTRPLGAAHRSIENFI